MQNNRPFSPTNPQRTGGILPPLSKYYYGPAVSPDRSPANAVENAPNAPQGAPTLPPRPLQNPASAPPTSQWPSSQNVHQSTFPGPPPTAPPAHPVAQSSYNPNNYGPMSGARLSPINAKWSPSSQSTTNADTSRWGVNYDHPSAQHSQSELKPPLPPRAPSSQSEQHTAPPENQVRPQENGSFEYLRPVAYSPAPSPSIPQSVSSPDTDRTQHTLPQPEAQKLPPPPPRKVPLYDESGSGYRPDVSSERPHGYGDSLQDHDQPGASKAHAVDTNVNQQRLFPPAPSLAAIGHPNGNSSSSSSGHVEVNQHDIDRITEQQPQRGNGRSLSHDVQETYGEVGSSNDQALHALHAPTIPEPPKGTEVTPPNVDVEPHTNVNGTRQVQRDDSFYWHSPHSSASMSHDRDQNQDVPGTSSLLDATPEPQEHNISPPPFTQESAKPSDHTTNLYQSTLGLYSASALGFGGPSDWEHFGDYDGEEVDDTDLYIRPRSPVKRNLPTDTSELPADPALFAVYPEQRPATFENSQRALSTAHQGSLQSITSSGTETKQDQVQLESDPVSEENVHDSKQPRILDHPATQTSDKAGQNSPLKQQSAIARSEATYLPQFPFEQVQQGPEDLRDVSDETSRDRHGITKDTLVEPVISRPTKEDRDELPSAPSNVQSSDWAATTDEKLMVDQKPASLDSQQKGTEPSFEGLFKAQRGDKDQSLPEKKAVASDVLDLSRENSIKRRSILSDGSVLSKIKEMEDPYADLDPWGKASLNRYVGMLREEARASTETEKLNKFRAFTRKEWKLRAVLYGADDEQENYPLSTGTDTPIQRARTLSLRRPASKALPALPPDANEPQAEAAQPKSLLSPNMHKSALARLMVTEDQKAETPSAAKDSDTIVGTPGGQKQKHLDEDASEIYSPGGRPVHLLLRAPQKTEASSGLDANDSHVDESNSLPSKERVPDDKPTFTPFRYSQGYIDDADKPVDRRASFRPYAALKIEPVEDRADSGPQFVSDSRDQYSLTSTAVDRQVRGSTSSSQSQASPKHNTLVVGPQASTATEQDPPLDLRRFERADFDPLIAVLPQSGQIPEEAVELSGLQLGMNVVPDDFSFIHQHMTAWDAKAKKIRADHERERQIRQGESEQRVDALFNDDEIGYGDISELESEFKRAEAARKTDEDRVEYQTFVEEVFNAVWTRLHFEIDQLSPLYEQYSELAHETLAGKDMFEAANGQYALAPTMSALLTLHQKLEIRHQKAFEAVLERDRRLKKTEVGAWYTLGNVSKVKQLEKQFERAEKKAIAEYCKQRNARINRLMDVLDQNTLRGVGANQDYMEAVMKAVRRIASGRAFASAPASEPGLGMDEVNKAKAVTAVLASSSEQIVQTFHVADMLLNAAECELSVATARLASADPPTFERLKEERAKEDTKLMRDLQHRLALIREDSRRTNDEIVKLLCFIGVQGGHAQANKVPNSSSNADAEHEQRIQKALEDAKRRNAQRTGGDGMP
ncbi:MAG: hypothetical protein LQ343_004734 [Gyalolechia ehrenbergii]|nr:MAG: hypothetical protein LQ343_004734 [Gyalolechia ehrenbergii]